MHQNSVGLITLSWLLLGCVGEVVEGSGQGIDTATDTATGTETAGGSTTSSSTSGPGGTATGTSGSSSATTDPTAGSDGGGGCSPGESNPCRCEDGTRGTQVCRPGQTFGPCDCSGGSSGGSSGGVTSGSTSGSSGGVTSGSTSGSSGGATSGTEPTGSTGGAGDACTGIESLELTVDQAVLTGSWNIKAVEGEGKVAAFDSSGGAGGAVTWTIDVPCADTWHIFVRYWQQGPEDSYFVTVDDAPRPRAIFEGDCTDGGQGFGWRELNWRDAANDACTYVADPWTFNWDPGFHDIQFRFRESQALGRVVVTNDPSWRP